MSVSREQALSLLAQANNHGDLAVKLSSLKQARDILACSDPSTVAELLPYLVELQYSPENLVRRSLVEAVEEIVLNAMELSSILMPVLLAFLRDNDPIVARKAIVSGTSIFNSILEELTLQFHRRGIVERWVEEFWTWMVKFKDAVFGVLWEDGPAGTKLMALKFVETYILLFTSDSHESEKPFTEAILKSGRPFNISWLVGGHPVLDPVALTSEANKSIGILLDLFRSVGSLPGPFAVSVVNCLAAVARKRPLHYNSLLSVLLDSQPSLERAKGGHMTSIQYSLRTAFLGFLRCTYPAVLESRERLVRALRGMSAGDAADQAIRQVDKMLKSSERALRDARLTKDDKPPNPLIVAGDMCRKRALPPYGEDLNNSNDVATKRFRVGTNVHPDLPLQMSDVGKDYSANGTPSKGTVLDTGLTAVEKMIGLIGALIAAGDRATESVDVLVSQIHPDLLADIVITNMRHLPKNPPPLTTLNSLPVTRESESSGPFLASISIGSPASIESPVLAAPRLPSSSDVSSTSLSDMYTSANLPADSKRDPRRDPRRLDPRRSAILSEMPSMANVEDLNNIQSEIATLLPLATTDESDAVSLLLKKEVDPEILETPVSIIKDAPGPKEEIVNEAHEISPILELDAALDLPLSPVHDYEDSMTRKSADNVLTDDTYTLSLLHSEELSPDVSNTTLFEEVCPDLPEIPSYVDLTEEQERTVRNLALERVIESFKRVQTTDCSQTRMSLLARLVAQIDTDEDVILMMQKHITSDYQLQKGHELVMHILFHLHALMVSDLVEQPSSAALVYEKFFMGVAKFLLDALPATDKSFSRLLSEVPFLSDPGLQLLHKVCCSDYPCAKDGREGDRVTQGLGVVWSLILGRPQSRKACLDIALKCSVHSQDDVRGKAIRLVANKLYVLDFISADIETFATNMLLSAIDQQVSESELSQSAAAEKRTERERGSEETSISGSFFSEPATSENDSMKGAHSGSQNDFLVLVAEAQRLISLFFALCAKNPRLLELVFKVYGRASRAAKQAIFRHIPTLIRALESSYPELLRIISEPPQGSEHLLTQVLHVLAEGTPSADLIATVKRLYETKLKDATILIPVLSSLSKSEVLPIFPRLVDLPLDKFQQALAHILQGSKNTGPALTPAEVLVAIHDIRPERDGLALKKITDACSACFEQRTVFTQQVLDKALNEMLNQTPLPLLFMRTVIQAIDAFPSLVDCVMDILSKLVKRQIWKMPKLWVGFLKCVSQTQPHSFRVLLQLPQQQLEGALSKYASLRSPLAAYASQPSIRASLPRSTLAVLGLLSEPQMQQQQRVTTTSLHASETVPSVHGAALT